MESIKELRINQSFEVFNCETLEEAKEQLEAKFQRENRTAENEFWDNLELVEVKE